MEIAYWNFLFKLFIFIKIKGGADKSK